MTMLVQVLEKTISQNPDDQKRALEYLEQASTNDICTFVKELSTILRQSELQSHVRQAAGLQLKNILYSKDETIKEAYLKRWLQLPADVRAHVKQHVTSTLGTESFRPSIAAQCVAAIACAEIPHGLWPSLFEEGAGIVAHQTKSEHLKCDTIATLGYICQDVDPNVLAKHARQILAAIICGQREEQTVAVRKEATKALRLLQESLPNPSRSARRPASCGEEARDVEKQKMKEESADDDDDGEEEEAIEEVRAATPPRVRFAPSPILSSPARCMALDQAFIEEEDGDEDTRLLRLYDHRRHRGSPSTPYPRPRR